MGNIDSKELAFFSILRGLISPNIKNEAFDVEISLDDLEEKMEMDKMIIAGFIDKLRSDGLIDITSQAESKATLHFERTDEKLLNIISVGELEDTLKDMNRFILKNISLFNFANPYLNDTSMKISALLEVDPNADISPILRQALSTMFSQPKANVDIAKLLYKACETADEEDAKILESIMYHFIVLPPEENPFLATVLLAAVSLQMEALKNC